MNKFSLWSLILLLALAAGLEPTIASVISYIRFEEGSGFGAFDQTGLMDGELLGFPDTSPGGGDTGSDGWSTSVPTTIIPLTGASNTGSLRFDGGGYVDLSNPNNLSLGITYTVEFFIRPEEPFIIQGVFGFGPSSDLYMILGRDGDGSLGYQFELQNQIFFGSITGVQMDAWQHVAFVKEPEEFSLYLNGITVTNTDLPTSTDGPYFFPGIDEVGNRTIGGESGTWRGWIDEFRISDTALTPDQFLGAFPIPEPSTFLLMLMGVGTLGLLRKQNKSHT